MFCQQREASRRFWARCGRLTLSCAQLLELWQQAAAAGLSTAAQTQLLLAASRRLLEEPEAVDAVVRAAGGYTTTLFDLVRFAVWMPSCSSGSC